MNMACHPPTRFKPASALLGVAAVSCLLPWSAAALPADQNVSPDCLRLSWNVLSISPATGRSDMELVLVNDCPFDLAAGGWELQWSMLSGRIDAERLPAGLSADRPSGDWHWIRADEGHALASGDSLRIRAALQGIIERVSSGPHGMYLVDQSTDAAHPVAVDFRWSKAEGLDLVDLPDAASRFDDHDDLRPADVPRLPDPAAIAHVIIPRPLRIETAGGRAVGSGGVEDWSGSGGSDRSGAAGDSDRIRVDRPILLDGPDGFAGLSDTFEEMFPSLVQPPARDGRPGMERRDDHGSRSETDGEADLQPEADRHSVAQDPLRVRIIRSQDSLLASEAYRMEIRRDGIRIDAVDRAGALYALMSLRQLLAAAERDGTAFLPVATVVDAPRFPYRGLHVDIGRNFFGADKIRQVLDLMAFHKLNRLHLNLTEDEGWRIEIASLPELTEVGARRGFTRDEALHLRPAYGSGHDPHARSDRGGGNGYWTRHEFVELLKAASARHIMVIPEVNSPGHARAAVVSMKARHRRLLAEGDALGADAFRLHDPADSSRYQSAQGYGDNVMNVCRESAYRFMELVVDDLASMYREAGLRLEWFHMGGDELPYGAWKGSPECETFIESSSGLDNHEGLASHYVRRLQAMLAERGIRLVGWEDILLEHTERSHHENRIAPEFLGTDIIPYVWNAAWGWGREDMIYRFANRGFDVVMANSSAYYFDMADDADPELEGLTWSGQVNPRDMWDVEPLDLILARKLQAEAAGEMNAELARQKDGWEPLEEGARVRFLGIQAQLWTETVRNEAIFDRMLVPNLSVFAEKAWSQPPRWVGMAAEGGDFVGRRSVDWSEFSLRLTRHMMPALDSEFGGIAYDLPKPGARIKGGMLHVNHIFPGMPIRYTMDGSAPTMVSPLYEGPVPVDAGSCVMLAAFSGTGRRGRIIRTGGC